MRGFRFVYRCPECGFSTFSDSPDLETCPIPWKGPMGLITCKGEYEDGPMLDWWLLPDEVQEAIRVMIPRRPENVETPT